MPLGHMGETPMPRGVMDIRMEHTAGYGQRAEVWVDGVLLTVCDGLSEPGVKCPPGEIEGVRFRYLSESPPSMDEMLAGNTKRYVGIEPQREWSYVGYGRIVSIMPTEINFGPLTMEDAHWTSDDAMVGKFVCVPIDRLEVEWAPPEEEL